MSRQTIFEISKYNYDQSFLVAIDGRPFQPASRTASLAQRSKIDPAASRVALPSLLIPNSS